MHKIDKTDKMTISINKELASKLIKLKEPGKTYQDVIEALYNLYINLQKDDVGQEIFIDE